MTDPNDKYDRHQADVLDNASALEMETTESAVRDIQAKAQPKRVPLGDGSFEETDCDDCGDAVGEQRLRVAINNHLCIHCATRRERLFNR